MPYTSDYARKAMGEKTPASKTVKVQSGTGGNFGNIKFTGTTKKTAKGSKTKLKSDFGSITERVKKGKGGSTDMTGVTAKVKSNTRRTKTVMKNKATGAKITEVKRFKKAM